MPFPRFRRSICKRLRTRSASGELRDISACRSARICRTMRWRRALLIERRFARRSSRSDPVSATSVMSNPTDSSRSTTMENFDGHRRYNAAFPTPARFATASRLRAAYPWRAHSTNKACVRDSVTRGCITAAPAGLRFFALFTSERLRFIHSNYTLNSHENDTPSFRPWR